MLSRRVARSGLGRPARLALAVMLLVFAGLLTAELTVPAPSARADSVRSAQQWVLDNMHAQSAWATSQGQGVTVAVLDSGVNPAVSDLAGSVTTGPDFTRTATSPSNPHWGEHGTWMAALIAGHGHGAGGGSGILGVAPRARILSVRAITDHDDPAYQGYQHEPSSQIQRSLASAIRYAVRHGAAVISMSIGYSSPSAAVRSALQYAENHGTVVVASSGNSGDSVFARTHRYAPYSFPADYPGVLAVGAANQNGSRAGFSSDNLSVEVAAPGVLVPTQGRDGRYWLVSGTSPACALVAGVIALIKSRYPALPPDLADQAVVATTRDRPPRGYDDRVGFGMVDAAAALAEAKVLARDVATAGLPARTYFGGGPSHLGAAPVHRRGVWPIAAFGILGLTSLVLVGAALTRIMVVRRARRHMRAGQVVPAGPAVPGGPRYPGGPALPGGPAPPPRPDSAPSSFTVPG